jgi:hypothetical protein
MQVLKMSSECERQSQVDGIFLARKIILFSYQHKFSIYFHYLHFRIEKELQFDYRFNLVCLTADILTINVLLIIFLKCV